MNGERSSELGAFLRARRDALTPEDVGLPRTGPRRVPGLRREEVAALAGVGLTWYTWLEQGRRISVSTQVLDALARLFRLTGDEHDYLYLVAGVPAARRTNSAPAAAEIDTVTRRVLDRFGTTPAAVFSERYDLIAGSAGFHLLFQGIANNTGLDRNALYKMGRAADTRHPVADPEYLAAMVTQVRHAYGGHVGDPDWERFIAEITGSSPVIAAAWASQEVGLSPAEHRFRCPPVGWIRFSSARYLLDRFDGAFLTVYLPLDDEAQQQFDEVVRRGGVSFT
ncbi:MULTISPECIES: helix-turn-helix transcriptional regulator [Tsukamurella]|uniref:Helix-turn-helix domain-containing protein n=1 Tax=Tsukamurella columbiensis TaxID=128509 RepID=A0ABX1LCZ5_9ACTN|nr:MULTISPECIES: helix-turn-helix transcriptional regulator [Tsukamurella]NMD55440.1 helix-turn-helix domain-containing protein [Tsukamurella columbiensis]